MKFDEQKLIYIAKPYLEKCRAGDWEHALRVVKWVKELGAGRDDLNFLITAAYIHDIGWSGVAPEGKLDMDELDKLEPKANENSPKMILEVLAKLQFTDSEIQTVNRFVTAADRHRANQEDEAIVVDADNLSKLCKEHITEKFKPGSYNEALRMFERELINRISTKKGKAIYPKLLSELKADFK